MNRFTHTFFLFVHSSMPNPLNMVQSSSVKICPKKHLKKTSIFPNLTNE